MKTIFAFAGLILSVGYLHAAEATIVAQPDLNGPLPKEWLARVGTWNVEHGEISAAEIPTDKHAAVLWHQVPMQAGAVDCEFKFDGAKVFILGCDGQKHIGRLVITTKGMTLVDDSTEVKGKSSGTKLAEAKLDLKPGEWYPLHYEWSGERMAAKIGELGSIEATNANLSKKKERWWFAVGGEKMKIRSVKVTEPR